MFLSLDSPALSIETTADIRAGFDYAIVNGVVVINDGKTRPQRPSQFIPNATTGGRTLLNSLH